MSFHLTVAALCVLDGVGAVSFSVVLDELGVVLQENPNDSGRCLGSGGRTTNSTLTGISDARMAKLSDKSHNSRDANSRCAVSSSAMVHPHTLAGVWDHSPRDLRHSCEGPSIDIEANFNRVNAHLGDEHDHTPICSVHGR